MIDDATVRALLARARADDDAALRQLLHGYVALQQALGEVLASVAARDGGAAIATVPALVRARARRVLAPPQGRGRRMTGWRASDPTSSDTEWAAHAEERARAASTRAACGVRCGQAAPSGAPGVAPPVMALPGVAPPAARA